VTTPLRNRIDLHTHTARSDGVLEPAELYRQMRAWGSDLVAITDHDTLAGVRELLAALPGSGDGNISGPRLIVGVEINTLADAELNALVPDPDATLELHILGLGVDPDDAAFEARLASQREARRERLERTLERLDALGLPVRDRLPAPPGGIDALGRPHVARALVAAGHASSVDDAFARYLDPGAAAYVRRVGMPTHDAIAAIAAAGGLPVLAHAPFVVEAPALLARLLDWGLRGLEVYYHDWDTEVIAAMAGIAAAHGLLATGGSDYHGDGLDYATAQSTVHVPPGVGHALLAALA
jgi:predicted metal-dependent phosphoesterase TrpH